MGKQINFYRNSVVEQILLDECARLGLQRFDRDGGTFVAFRDPEEKWFESDSNKYASALGNGTHHARLWTGFS